MALRGALAAQPERQRKVGQKPAGNSLVVAQARGQCADAVEPCSAKNERFELVLIAQHDTQPAVGLGCCSASKVVSSFKDRLQAAAGDVLGGFGVSHRHRALSP